MPATDNFQTISPIDGRLVCETAYSTDADINTTLAQRSDWGEWSRQERITVIRQFLTHFESEAAQIAKDICLQMGRPAHQALGEVKGVVERANYLISQAEETLCDKPVSDNSFIRHLPLGKVLIIAPWNYPYLTAINSLIPALIAGNEVLLKHASQTPLCAKQIRKSFDAAGLPKAALQILYLTHSNTERLIQHPKVQFVCFTGSNSGGYAVHRAASSRLIRTSLELGGKDAAIVLNDCSLDSTVDGLIEGSFYNSGQSCCGVERIYVDENLFLPFVETFIEKTKHYQLGNPLEAETTLGPMVGTQAATKVRAQIKEAIDAGAKTLINERDYSESRPNTPYLAPQVLIDVNHQMAVMRDESFGPVVGVMPFKSQEQAVTLANDSVFGLTASIWSEDKERALSLGEQLDVGTVYLNRCDYLNPALAWHGVKESGLGLSLSYLAFYQMTRTKSFNFG